MFLVCVEWNGVQLTVCSEQQPSQQTPDYELLDTSRPDAAVYSHTSHSSEPAYENRDARPKDTSNVEYEDFDAVAPVHSN